MAFPWPDLLPELRDAVRRDYIRASGCAMLAMTCRAEALARLPAAEQEQKKRLQTRYGNKEWEEAAWKKGERLVLADDSLLRYAITCGHQMIVEEFASPRLSTWLNLLDLAELAMSVENAPAMLFLIDRVVRDRGEGAGAHVARVAAAKGQIAMLRVLADHGYLGLARWVMESAVRNGQLAVMQWLVTEWGYDLTRDEETINAAATHGDIAILDWLYANKC